MRTCISLFTGAGGLDIGLAAAGFKTIFANDLDPICKASYCHPTNFGNEISYYVGSATEVTPSLIKSHISLPSQVDLLAGGPPCPPYSKSRFYRTDKPRGVNDPVGDETLTAYLTLLEQIRPKAFLFENVHGFAFKVHKAGFDRLCSVANKLGYELSHRIVNAADYGVPQVRMRFIMVGMLGAKFAFPSPTHRDPSQTDNELLGSHLPPWRTAGDALSDLDTEPNASDEGHFAGGQFNDLLRQIPPGENYLFFTEKRGHPEPRFKWRSRYWSFLLKLSPSLPSWTIQARRSNNMGPFHWRSRILRIGEVKRLQSFPDNWFLAGNLEHQWRQVGNAVPPQLAGVLGTALMKQLDEVEVKQRRRIAA
jgi:DNA (cytosine-5)-methyltransferase 1